MKQYINATRDFNEELEKVKGTLWSEEEVTVLRASLFNGAFLVDIQRVLPYRPVSTIRKKARRFNFRSKKINGYVQFFRNSVYKEGVGSNDLELIAKNRMNQFSSMVRDPNFAEDTIYQYFNQMLDDEDLKVVRKVINNLITLLIYE